MKITVQIRTGKEQSNNYIGEEPNKKFVTNYLNKKDEMIADQSISFEMVGFEYAGSLQPLEEMISKWISKKMYEQIKIDAEAKRAELDKKIVRADKLKVK